MSDLRRVFGGAVGAAATNLFAVDIPTGDARYVSMWGNFTYGSGGTTVKCYLEGSWDGGTNWVPVANITFALATDEKMITVVPATTPTSIDADAAQADDTALSILPPRLRVREVITGTYVATTLDLYIHVA